MAKTDMERIGLFSEPGYTTISDKYKSSFLSKFRNVEKTKELISHY